jgi:microcystin-dependent protein
MPDTFTPNYNLVKVEVGGSTDTWGGKLNVNADTIDAAIRDVDGRFSTYDATPDPLDIIPYHDAGEGQPLKNMLWSDIKKLLAPAGEVAYFYGANPPAGWLKANGQNVSRTTYADLWVFMGSPNTGDGSTTFTLPDLRGEFIRGVADGRAVDTGRALGSAQGEAFLNHSHAASSGFVSNDHTHNYSGNTSGRSAAHTHSTWAPVNGNLNHDSTNDGDYGVGGGWTQQTSTESADHVHFFSGTTSGISANHNHTITVNASTTGGTETRPRNVALLACIRY